MISQHTFEVASSIRNICSLSSKALLTVALGTVLLGQASAQSDSPAIKPLRVATYNVSLNRNTAGKLREDLVGGHAQARSVAAVIRQVRPDVLFLNEVDFDGEKPSTAKLFAEEYLADDQPDMLGGSKITYPFIYTAPVNTGEPSGLDLNNNGKSGDPEDSFGYGKFPGQYGMALLSRFPIDARSVRGFQQLRWSAMPDAIRPAADGTPYYSDDVWQQLRISSKSFWDVPVQTPFGVLHVLASHPTPPAFDGPEDRNGARNHDEIRLLTDYLDGRKYLIDDNGRSGGLPEGASFVVVGDLNSDPNDGGSRSEAIRGLLEHPLVDSTSSPSSDGAVAATQRQGKANKDHKGESKYDTSDFNDRSVGNLRVDYVLPSRTFRTIESGVFWPLLESFPESKRDALLECLRASDHHLVWIDVVPSK